MNNTDTKGVNVSGVVVEICGSFFIVLEHVFAIFLISKCRIVQTSVKILVTNLCTIDIIAGFWGCIRATLRFYLTDERMLCMLDILLTTWVFNVSAFLVSAIAIDRYISVFFSNENVIKRSKEKNAFMLQCYKPLYTIIINYICKWLEHRTVRYFYTLPFDNFISYINKDNDVCYIYYQFTTGSVFP